jgi:hypothetical protein
VRRAAAEALSATSPAASVLVMSPGGLHPVRGPDCMCGGQQQWQSIWQACGCCSSARHRKQCSMSTTAGVPLRNLLGHKETSHQGCRPPLS